jgi:hypothetical protein
MWKAVAYSTWDSWRNQNHSIGCWRNQWICTTDAPFLVNCWFSNFMNFSSINMSDTKTWISTSYLWGATWDSWKSHLLLMRLAASTKFLTQLIGFSLVWIMAPWTPHFQNHQLPCFWHETIPVRSADREVVARNHGSRRHFVRLVLWARPMIFGGKENTFYLLSDKKILISRIWLAHALPKVRVLGLLGAVSRVISYLVRGEGGNFWSRWLSFARHHIWIHVLNILTNILFEFTSSYMYTFI